MDDNMKDGDIFDIPDFLRRDPNNPLPNPPILGDRKEIGMIMRPDTETTTEDEGTGLDAPAKPAKAKASSTNGHSKPAKAAKPAKVAKPAAKAKATDKPAKAAKAPAEKDVFGYRKGSLKSKAATLYSNKKGATLDEVKTALGSVQLNVLTELEGKGHKVKKTKEAGDGKRQVTRYHLSA